MRNRTRKQSTSIQGVAVFKDASIQGEVVITNDRQGIVLKATFTKLPPGPHGFHIHKAGDLRGEGCMGLCEHYDLGHHVHGAGPTSKKERHTGDLGNIALPAKQSVFRKSYYIKGPCVMDLLGRSLIVHEDEDDLGQGGHDDSKTTGHSGKRMGCAIIGRALCSAKK
jgi:Cu-Zn family superoxide dismutase